MKLNDFDYHLPPHLIAQSPSVKRDQSRLMVVHKSTGIIEHKSFHHIIDYLDTNSVLVLNNTTLRSLYWDFSNILAGINVPGIY